MCRMNTLSHPPEIFEQWLAACAANPWEPLSAKAAEPYRCIWESWQKHLGATHWTSATGTDVLSFINTLRLSTEAPSEITRRRYWRVLDRIYEFAELHELAPHNAAQQVGELERPPSEDPQGVILSPRMWSAVTKHLPTIRRATDARDCAVLRILVETAPTPSELANMRTTDLLRDADQHVVAIHFNGKFKHQQRALATSHDCAVALDEYISTRYKLTASANASPHLFLARGKSVLDQTLQQITKQHLTYTAYREGLPEPARLGPQVFRNTAIVHWLLEGRSVSEVLRMTGLKSPSGLERLRIHLPVKVRQAISTTSPAESND